MNLLIAAQSGWGKSHTGQEKLEKNIPNVDSVIVLDYKDEYRGLVEYFSDVKWHPIGPKELALSPEDWAERIKKQPKMVMPLYLLSDEEWRYACACICRAVRMLTSEAQGKAKFLLYFDEAHAVAPQGQGFPDELVKIAKVGRGEMVSTIWVTQRLADLDKGIITQCQARYIGGFTEENDLQSPAIEYPREVHNPTATKVRSLPEELRVDGNSMPVRKFTDSNEDVIGSEWIYSDESGKMWREIRDGSEMRSIHYGRQGYRLEL